MHDLWSFLLQTLTASGVAVLLLAVKALFRDKLSPKWQFAVWSSLGLILLIPAGYQGRYTLFPWRSLIEMLKSLCGDYRYTNVYFPLPYLDSFPKTLIEWIFVLYVLGVLCHLLRYLVSYLKLRLFLRNGERVSDDVMERVRTLATDHKVKMCRVIRVKGLPGAFLCGVIRPILVIPADGEIDDKILIHELMHLKSRDTFWNALICFFRCIHWCNPLLVFCARRALSDIEARCDQRVLESLEGEERRDYGRILLSMANERFSKTPASTCINNGGKQIGIRIEAITRFKKYPVGMKLVSICALLILSVSLAIGVRAAEFREIESSVKLSLASARSIPCSTYAGAFDAYGKALIKQNGYYRAMCAPESMQKTLETELLSRERNGLFPDWETGLPAWPKSDGYYIYNLTACEDGAYEALMVIELNYPPDGKPGEYGMMYLAVQTVRAEKENGRWVILPQEDFRSVEALRNTLDWGCEELPGVRYTKTIGEFRVDVLAQSVHRVKTTTQTTTTIFGSVTESHFDTAPIPNATFDSASMGQYGRITHLGTQVGRDAISHIGISLMPVYTGEERPANMTAAVGHTFWRSGSTGEDVCSQNLSEGWDYPIRLGGGGGTFDPTETLAYPEYYAVDLYVNQKLWIKTELYPQGKE